MKTRFAILSFVVLGLFAAPALCDMSYGDGGAALTDVLDSITTNPAGNSSVNVVTDPIAEGQDDQWRITAVGGSVATMIIEVAGWANTNTFGVYDFSDPTKSVQLFDGSAAAGAQAMLSIMADGSVKVNLVDTGVDFAGVWFGFYIDSSGNLNNQGVDEGGRWYSDTTRNSDGLDHMVAIQGTNTDTVQLPGLAAGLWTDNEFVLAFEDKAAQFSDRDYDDLVVMVESVMVPVPGAVLLGLLGLSVAGARLRKRS
ncbi:MAG TPA: DUF4114 domain-containing protein [Sedimentisphaerales bacterium]|nr:DUF4114 domain-containing protein [Sedimentisphaerales bacterium]